MCKFECVEVKSFGGFVMWDAAKGVWLCQKCEKTSVTRFVCGLQKRSVTRIKCW